MRIRRMIVGGLAAGLLWPVASLAQTPAPAGAPAPPITMVVQFAIKDYATWRPVFDAAEPERAKAGVTAPRVFQDADRAGQMLVLFTVPTRAKGNGWMKSAAVKEAWRKGGVVGDVTHRFLR